MAKMDEKMLPYHEACINPSRESVRSRRDGKDGMKGGMKERFILKPTDGPRTIWQWVLPSMNAGEEHAVQNNIIYWQG
jgi:hypothetical protein